MAETKLHHKKSSFCASRPKYREARWERAVKVYTINLESQYLLVQGVPALGVTKDLLETFAIYGAIDEYRILDDYPAEEFTNVYWVKFKNIMAARKAKRKLDNRSFFGGILHVTYAPEFESVEETRQKLMDRKRVIERKIKCVGQGPRGEKPAQVEQLVRRQECVGLETSGRHPSIVMGQETGDGGVYNGGSYNEGDKYVERIPPTLPPSLGHMYPSQSSTLSSSWQHPQLSSTRATQANLHPRKMTQTIVSYPNQKDKVQVERKEKEIVESKREQTMDRHSVREKDMVIQSDLYHTLTGNPSLDRTILSIREKLNQIKNTDPLAFRYENAATEETSKRPLKESEGVAREEKKKQRKRI